MNNDWINKGNQFYKDGLYKEAVQCYDQALKLDPKNIAVWNNRGLSLTNLGLHEEAVQSYSNALKINTQYFNAWSNLGISLDALKEFEKALTCFDKALELNSKHVLSWQKKGDTLHNMGRYEDAINCYMMAVKLDDRNILAWYYMGLCADKIGLNAFLAYSKVITLAMGWDSNVVVDGDSAALEVLRVERVRIKEEYLTHAMKRVGEINEQESSADNQKKTVNYDASEKVSTSAVAPPQKQPEAEFHEQDANYWYMKGKQLCDSEDYEEAIHCFDNALRLEPQYAYAWREKARCEENLGYVLDAIYSYEQALDFAEDETQLIQSVVARLSELEKDQNPSVKHEENISNPNSKIDQNTTEQITNAICQPGDIIAEKYEVHKVLGMGGFGIVYLVSPCEAGDEFLALKTFKDKFLSDVQIRERFRKEANVLTELEHHPNLVRTYFVEETSGRLFIAMEYIAPNEQGINSLAGYMLSRPPSLVQSLRWAIQVCFGMEYAYSKGIRAHRDLKPENIMIGQDGTAKVTDFGLAGVLATQPKNSASYTNNIDQFKKTQIGIGFGTPTHMPPEQFIDAASCDERSDIYAFGVVLFQMVSGGEPPFLVTPPKSDWQDWFRLHNEASIPLLKSPLLPIIQRCLEKNPDKRYQRFVLLRSDLELMLTHQNGERIKAPQLKEPNAWEWSNKGFSLNRLGRYEEAIPYFDKALEINSHLVDTLNNKGDSLNLLGRYEEAIRYFDKALEIDPFHVNALSNKGYCLNNLKRWEEAIRYLDKALEINPFHISALINKSNSLGDLGRYEESLYCCDKALEINPSVMYALYNKGNILSHLGRYEEAIHCFSKALEIDPCDVDALNNKGYNLNNLGHYEEALYYFDKVLEIGPRDIGAFYNKGISLNGLERYEEAIHYFDKALEINPRYAGALFNKANSLEGFGCKRDAALCYRQLLTISTNQEPKFAEHLRQRIRELEGK